MSKRGKGQHCAYCGRRLHAAGAYLKSWLSATRDHVHPKSKPGESAGLVTVWACRLCNNLKGNLLPEDWRAFMAAFPRWWTMEQFKGGSTAAVRRAMLSLGKQEAAE